MIAVPTRKIRVYIEEGNGDRYTITFEGRVTREKALKLLDLVELLGGMPTVNSRGNHSVYKLSKIDKIRSIINDKYPIGWFSTKDIQITYEQEYKEPIKMSTVSTYLSRMRDRDILTKDGVSYPLHYKLKIQR